MFICFNNQYFWINNIDFKIVITKFRSLIYKDNMYNKNIMFINKRLV